jgi:quercetin dioxygenase-like cupin family protein
MTDKDTRRPHNFVANHLEVGSFEEGFRAYAKYRDLGMVEATNGMVRAHVIKLLPPFNAEEVSKRHAHDVEFQLLYCLKGWMKGEYDGEEVMMREGSCWLQPPNIKHTVLGYSDDCELLEIIMPADFDTEEF